MLTDENIPGHKRTANVQPGQSTHPFKHQGLLCPLTELLEIVKYNSISKVSD